MGFNRIVDRRFDARNPRTAGRELPAGAVSLRAAWTLTLAAAALFVAAAAYLGPICLALSPVALALLFGYSFTKRFTFLCHLFLGLAIAAGPGGAWIAVRGDFGRPAALLMIAVASWIGGFDVLYAIADADFDRQAGLHSIPARFGDPRALFISAALHAITAVALVALAPAAGLGVPYLLGVAVVVGLLVGEHVIVRPSDLSRLNVAFFNLNGYVSVVVLPGHAGRRASALTLSARAASAARPRAPDRRPGSPRGDDGAGASASGGIARGWWTSKAGRWLGSQLGPKPAASKGCRSRPLCPCVTASISTSCSPARDGEQYDSR